jgi:hypothetical protein
MLKEGQMLCDWIFLSQDGSRTTSTLNEQRLPQLGDGKQHNGKGYEVSLVVTNRINAPNPTIVAIEWTS